MSGSTEPQDLGLTEEDLDAHVGAGDLSLTHTGRSSDPRRDYDAMRAVPLAYDHHGRPVLCRHADVVAAAHNPATYSSRVSRFLQVPNGLDGDAHRGARDLFDPFFSPGRMAELEPRIAEVASNLVAALPYGQTIEAVGDLGARFAVRAQSAWLGWPQSLEEDLLAWMADNHDASRSGDLVRTRDVAEHFDDIIRQLVRPRRETGVPDDLTTELAQLHDASGALLSEEVLVSVLRNWTGGDLGSMALCVGVVTHWLAAHPRQQDDLRAGSDADLVAAIDEMLRIDDPFVANRRIVTADISLSGCPVQAGQEVVLNWTAANRDPEVFDDAERFNPEQNASANLVYGTGSHACPGRPLAAMELRVLIRTLVTAVHVARGPHPAQRERPPRGGYSRVPIIVAPRSTDPSIGVKA
ncbi:MAG: cytochrome P450 [Propionibacteriaceae bacterium]